MKWFVPRFSRLNYRASFRWKTVLVLGSLFVGTAACLRAATTSDIKFTHQNEDLSDAVFYQRVAERVEAGENYYEVAKQTLPAHGFETGSTFNWRTPLYAHILGKFGQPVARQVTLAVLSLIAAIMAARMITRDLGPIWGVIAGLVVFGASGWWLQAEPPWFTETWGGQLILLTIAARSLGWFRVGLIAGSLALFLRELALPFVVLCLGDAWQRRRWTEALSWSLCLALYGLFFLYHDAQVTLHQNPDVRFRPDRPSWIDFGGLSFLLATVRMNYLLSYLPIWCTAFYLPLAVFGLVSLAATNHDTRWTLLGFSGYLIAFLAVGKGYNHYWGWITAPTLALGFAVAPVFLSRVVR